MKVVITSGGTREPIDNVRVITNVAKGTLGALIAQEALNFGWEVVYVYGRGAKKPVSHPRLEMIETGSVSDTQVILEKVLPQADAIVHSMAVSDYVVTHVETVDGQRLEDTKINSDFEQLKICLSRAPKLIASMRSLAPDAYLVGFKLLDNATDDQLKAAALKTMRANDCDLVVANDLAQIRSGQPHRGLLIDTADQTQEIWGKEQIARQIIETIAKAREL